MSFPLALCRICGARDHLTHVFNGSTELLNKIRMCANIMIDFDDRLPKHICQQCEQGLEFSYRLRKQGESTDLKFRMELLKAEEHLLLDEVRKEMVTKIIAEHKEDLKYVCEPNGKPLISDNEWEEGISFECSEVLEVEQDKNYEPSTIDDLNCEVREYTLYGFVNEADKKNVAKQNTIHLKAGSPTENILQLQHEDSPFDDEAENTEYFEQEEFLDEEIVRGDSYKEDCEDNLNAENQGKQFNPLDKIEKTSFNRSTTDRKQERVLYTCETCNQQFDLKTFYHAHLKEHSSERFYCSICSKWFGVRYRYMAHIKDHTNRESGEAFSCIFCDRSYTMRWNLERHVRITHTGEKRFQCNECGACFGRADILKNHQTSHLTVREYQCHLCPKRFKSPHYLSIHKKSHLPHNLRQKRVKAKRYLPKDDNMHSVTVEGKLTETFFFCEFCKKISRHRGAHQNHLRTHTLERPFHCKTCSKEFRTSAALKAHGRCHTDERPYKCDKCNMAFRQSAHLKSHKLIHDGIMQHICNVCQMTFTMKSNLSVHMRIHTGEKPYECVECGQHFAMRNQMKRHTKLCHGLGIDEKVQTRTVVVHV